MSVDRYGRASVSVFLVSALVLCLMVVTGGPAHAAGTVLFAQTFANNTANGTGPVVLPLGASNGANAACLTRTGNASTGPIVSCPTSTFGSPTVNDTFSPGALSLTPLQFNKTGGVFAATSVPTVQGLDVSFTLHQWGGTGGGADGIAFGLSAVNPAAPLAPPNIGPSGGALGYSAAGSVKGLSNGYLGFGFDTYGNFSSTSYQGSGCAGSTFQNGTNRVVGQVLVRGPGNNTVGYCPLNGTGANASSSTPPVVAMRGSSRAGSVVPVRIIMNAGKTAITSATGFDVPAESYLLAFTPVGGAERTLTGLLPVMSSSMVGSPSWLDADGLPKQLAFGWVGSTGSVNDNHEVSNVTVSSLNSVTQLTVSQVNYSPPAATTTTPLPIGSPVGYVVTPGVAAGLPESGTVTVTETVPAGVVPLGATGTGWVCGAPSGQTISCTNSNGPFAAGTSLPTITVSAVVTGSSVSQTTLQNSSVVTASSELSDPGYSTSSTTGSNPTAPVVTSLSPTSGPIGGGNSMTITGTSLSGATSVQIGTAAEFAAGTTSTLTPCVSVAAPGCFTVSNGKLVISSLPGHALGTVTVRVINLGAFGSATYSYTKVPASPVVTAVAGVTSATVSWSGSDGGSPIIGYTVTPVLNGSAQSPKAVTGTSTSFTGLTAGASYTFRVTATNANGTGPVGISDAVVPYSVPTAPQTPTATASTTQATVNWSAPTTDNGSSITGYTVTPYLGAVAQTQRVFASTALTQTITGLTAGNTYTFTVKATNAAGTGPESAKTSAVTINSLPTLALPTPVQGEVGAPYANPGFTVSGGTAPFSWIVDSGSLPAGLTLSAAGVISGTPTVSGTASFTVKVTDSAGKTASQPLTLTIAPAPVLANPAAPAGQVGVAYSDQLVVKAGTGTGPFSWSVSAGSLPPGVALGSSTGLLSGTPTTVGTYGFTVRVTDAQAQAATQTLSITVTPSPSLSFPAPPAGQVAAPYSHQLVVTGGTGPYTWSTTGTLPPGLTLAASTGLLSGTPTSAGSYPFTVRVQDSTGQSDTRAVILTIAASPTLSFTPPAGEVGVAYTAAPVVTGGTSPFAYTISAGSLPPGLTLNGATGAITGTPTSAANTVVTVRVSDAFGQLDNAAGTLLIVAAPTLALPVPPVGDVGSPYSTQLTVNGGTAPFTWSITSGTLQAGLTLNPSTGLISGTPTDGGSATVTVAVADGFGSTDSQPITVVIRRPSTVSLSSSVSSTSPGGAVVLTATVGPATATGSVAFTDTITTGPQAGSSFPLGSSPVAAGGTASTTVTLSSFGSHHIVAAYSGDGAQSPAESAARIVEVVATSGSVLVSEFRLSGPAGTSDDYVELANVSAQPVELAGFKVATSSGTVSTLPTTAPALLPGRSYLLAGSDFSLGAMAHPDRTSSTELGSGGLSVRAPDSAGTQTDAVGPDDAGYHLGTALPAFSGSPTAQYAWVRTQASSYLKNTQDNAADFALVSTSSGPVGGVSSMLGSPSPTGQADPWLHTFVVRSALLDPGVAIGANPNRIVVKVQPGTPGAITVRRTLTNTTSDTVTAMRIRLHSLSELNGLNASGVQGPLAQLRAVDPGTAQTSVTVAGSPVIVQNLSVDAPASAAPGGGLNSTYTVPLPPAGLAGGASVSVSFTFAADTAGAWWFGYDVDTLGLG